MFSTKHFFLVLTVCFHSIHFLRATKKFSQRQYINCANFTQVKKPYDIIVDDDTNIDDEPEPMDEIFYKLNNNVEKIRYSLCQIKNNFEREIHLAEIEADTFNNDRLEQLDGTVTSRRVGSALRHTVLQVGECVSNTAKQVLLLPIRVKSEIPCITRELLLIKNFSTDVAHVITGALKAIVHYPRHMAICFKTDEKINCLAKLHKKVIKNTIADIMGIAYKSVDIDRILLTMGSRASQCADYLTTISKLATIPLKLSLCISNKIY